MGLKMIKTDMHLHTCYSHGKNTPFEMHAAAEKAGLGIIGFTEHSPRPAGFDYTHEYREKLSAHLDTYVREVLNLKNSARKSPHGCQVLFGMEIDWLEGEEDFIRQACSAYDFDYLIGSVHFLHHWGFDDGNQPWLDATSQECEKYYEDYFLAWHGMLASGFFQVAAHPDLIKIHSVHTFQKWLEKPRALELIHVCLTTLRDSGMAMEVSSAGLRKPCAEIYPAPQIMKMAASLDLPVSFASDAHCVNDVGHAFPELARYAHAHGLDKIALFDHGTIFIQSF